MAEVFALDMHVQVCRGRLNRAKAKKHACLEHRKDFLDTFSIDGALDTPDIHP